MNKPGKFKFEDIFTDDISLHAGVDTFKDVRYVVEASSDEKFQLWNKWNDGCQWEPPSRGHMYQLGWIDVGEDHLLPVCVTFWIAVINGLKIMFTESTSLATHHGWIEDTAMELCGHPKADGRVAHCDSMNFNNVANFIARESGRPMSRRDLD